MLGVETIGLMPCTVSSKRASAEERRSKMTDEQCRREEESEAGGNDDVDHSYTLILTILRMTRIPRSMKTCRPTNSCWPSGSVRSGVV